MIPGSRGGPAHPLRATAVLTLAVGGVLAAVCLPPAPALAATPSVLAPPRPVASAPGSGPADWVRGWSWRSGSGKLPKGCYPYAGRSSSGARWSPSLVSVSNGHLRLATASVAGQGRALGSGVGCTGRPQRYGRMEVRARIPAGAGLVGRVALWPSSPSRGSDWSGLTVPAADLSPAYATNGCGDEAYGASVPGRLAGAFHTYVLTWTPSGFAVTVDGRRLYQDDEAFDGERWLGISLTATGTDPSREHLVVDEIVTYRWAGAVPAASTAEASGSTGTASTGAAPGAPASGAYQEEADAARAALTRTWSRDQEQTAGGAGDGSAGFTGSGGDGPGAGITAAAGGSTVGGPGTPAAAAAATGSSTLVGVLEGSDLGTPWLVAGAGAVVAVLAGVVRAALSTRRRPPVPL